MVAPTMIWRSRAAAPQDGIVFIDEIDKIVVSSDVRDGADASSAGVQART